MADNRNLSSCQKQKGIYHRKLFTKLWGGQKPGPRLSLEFPEHHLKTCQGNRYLWVSREDGESRSWHRRLPHKLLGPGTHHICHIQDSASCCCNHGLQLCLGYDWRILKAIMSHATSAGSASAKWKQNWLQPLSHLTKFLIKILSEKPKSHKIKSLECILLGFLAPMG